MAASSATLHEPAEKLSPATIDRHRAIVSLMEELEAVDWYDQRVDAASGNPAHRRSRAGGADRRAAVPGGTAMTNPCKFFVPGPTWVRPAILQELTRPMIGHRSPEFRDLFTRINADLKTLFATKQDTFVVTASGTGVMQAALEELSVTWKEQGRPVIPMGIGINSGEAIAGNIGSPEHMEYTVIGDTVNVAARLTSVAGPGEILLGESTWLQVNDHIECDPLPPLPLKGKREPAKVYRVAQKKFQSGAMQPATGSGAGAT